MNFRPSVVVGQANGGLGGHKTSAVIPVGVVIELNMRFFGAVV
jgi:hypothetical protein